MTLLEAAQIFGLQLQNMCGGIARCGKCRVQVLEGSHHQHRILSRSDNLSPTGDEEKKILGPELLQANWRLACQAHIQGDVTVFVPNESLAQSQIILKAPSQKEIPLKPAVKKHTVQLTTTTLHNPISLWDCLKATLCKKISYPDLSIDFNVLQDIPNIIKTGNRLVTASVWLDREVIALKAGSIEMTLGLAMDIGTTTVAVYLCDLSTGEVLTVESMVNPQVAYGDDVLTRITYTLTHSDGTRVLNRIIIQGLNELIRKAASKVNVGTDEIADVTVVGNTCMHHLFLGLDPANLGRSPYVPLLHQSLDVKARDIGLDIAPGAYVHILPVIAGFVGPDTVGVLIAEEPYNRNETILVIDVGTNGELILSSRKGIACTSCATGPALEGATIKHGMRASPGAIEAVQIKPGSLEVVCKVIAKEQNGEYVSTKATGICGSGIIDAVAQLFRVGILHKNGRFNYSLSGSCWSVTNGVPAFVLAQSDETADGREIVICRDDIRALMLAKGAIHSSAKLLMAHAGVKQLDKVILAGAFGSCINRESALTIGLFPACQIEDIYSVGNAAGDGARIALLNVDKRFEADDRAREITNVELSTLPEFQREFAHAMFFPHFKDTTLTP